MCLSQKVNTLVVGAFNSLTIDTTQPHELQSAQPRSDLVHSNKLWRVTFLQKTKITTMIRHSRREKNKHWQYRHSDKTTGKSSYSFFSPVLKKFSLWKVQFVLWTYKASHLLTTTQVLVSTVSWPGMFLYVSLWPAAHVSFLWLISMVSGCATEVMKHSRAKRTSVWAFSSLHEKAFSAQIPGEG